MGATSFLNGKVIKQSLPTFQGSPPAEATGPKRLFLAQGELANIYDAEEGIRYIALIELRAGSVRGNHFHRIKEEWIYLRSGRLLLKVQEGEAGTPVTFEMEPGDLVRIATGIAHALKPLADGEGVEFSPAKFDPLDAQMVALL